MLNNRGILTVTKEFSWDCAHMLAGHDGLCRNLHGHTYKMLVTVTSANKDTVTAGPKKDMLIDFKDLKNVVNDILVSKLDHAFVANENTASAFEQSIIRACENFEGKMYLLPARPTAEVMIQIFAEKLQVALAAVGIELVHIRLFETPTSYADWEVM